MSESLTFEKSRHSLGAPRLPASDRGSGPVKLPKGLGRKRPPELPRLSEPEIMRHYSRLASMP